ncbi:radical SAM family heme chaperone HemW [Prosthecochloris sp. ZM_2]|nr:radical SAM family heme chaperone HemW [Prosthecochloris sp. ZM_2]RNA65513.1 radical SAM family heme chaperone HemW [Prosthecochloris sp. ZM_2]
MVHCYVHIPFCRERCSYCDFFLVTRRELQPRFFTALREETAARRAELAGKSVRSIHFGGGTPSLVEPRFLADWLHQLDRLAHVSGDAEITLEANPEDLSDRRLSELAAIGVNRLSIGIQSFSSRKLQALGRAHDGMTARQVVRHARKMFSNISIDLICGAEHESPGEWEGDLAAACSFDLPHVSVYMLTVEPGTMLARDLRNRRREVPGQDEQAAFYLMAADRLSASGFEHYEVSNFGRKGFFSRYNMGCWQREPYLGFGPSAHSLITRGTHEVRRANARSLTGYLRTPSESVEFIEELTEEAVISERVFLSLRLQAGLRLDELRSLHTVFPEHLLEEFRRRGWVEVRSSGELRLTSRGYLFADFIAQELLPG